MDTLQWASTETFEISGYELETVVNMLTAKLSSPEYQGIIREYETLRLLKERIRKGVEEGKVQKIDSE